jgi:hypothetical protein
MSDVSESEISAAESSFEESSNEKTTKKSRKRASTSSKKPRKSTKSSSRAKKVDDETRYKSAAMIEDSDIEEDYEVDENGHVKMIRGSAVPVKAHVKDGDDSDSPEPVKKKRKVDKVASSSTSKESVKPRRVSSENKAKKESKSPVVEIGSLSDGESAPAAKTKTKSKDKTEAPKRTSKKAELSKDEETIKQLKSFVVACGVRKVWSKEFKDIEDSPSSQIRKLRQILAELGMTGRMSLAKAKEIKAKRDMAQELEDVQTFHENIVTGPRKRKTRGQQPEEKDDESEGSESEAESGPPGRKTKNAHQSIMAFLGDQSDDD